MKAVITNEFSEVLEQAKVLNRKYPMIQMDLSGVHSIRDLDRTVTKEITKINARLKDGIKDSVYARYRRLGKTAGQIQRMDMSALVALREFRGNLPHRKGAIRNGS